MIGSGMPINQSKAPFPKDMVASIFDIIWRYNAGKFEWFLIRNMKGR
jgi:hypothetical protein